MLIPASIRAAFTGSAIGLPQARETSDANSFHVRAVQQLKKQNISLYKCISRVCILKTINGRFYLCALTTMS